MTDTDLKTALDAVAARAPRHDLPDGGSMVVIPEGYKAERVDPLMPSRVRQSVTLHDRDSFVAYVNRFKNDDTRVFAEPGFLSGGSAKITSVIDYHGPKSANHGGHTATYAVRYSENWDRWRKVCSQPLKQSEFAEFIEECRADIVEPDAARLLDIVRSFKASKRVEFDSVVYQPNGDVKLAYDERTEQKGSSGPLPETMTLGIPVYFRGAAFKVPVFIRYKVGQGAVGFQIKIDRADIVEDVAFSELAKSISEATSIDAYLGRR